MDHNIVLVAETGSDIPQELAQKLGITAQAVSQWERGETMPDILTIPVLADVFNCSIEELIKNKTELVVAEEPSFSLRKEDPVEPIKVAKRLIAKIVALPLKERIEVERIVDKMLADLEDE